MKQRTDYADQQSKLKAFLARMTLKDKDFYSYQALADKWHREHPREPPRPITNTEFWHWTINEGNFPETYFYATPPIAESPSSNRILVTGTNVEVRDMDAVITGFEAYKRVMDELARRKGTPMISYEPTTASQKDLPGSVVTVASSLPAIMGVKPVYNFAARVGSFWENFFGADKFLDEPERISVPLAIVGTGFMRNYNACGGATMNVKDRLEVIANDWNIPIQIIESWAP